MDDKGAADGAQGAEVSRTAPDGEIRGLGEPDDVSSVGAAEDAAAVVVAVVGPGAVDGVQGAEVPRTAPDGEIRGLGEPDDVCSVGAAEDAVAVVVVAVVGPGAVDGVQGAEAPRTAPDGGACGVGEPGEACGAAGEPVVAQAPGGHWAASGVEGRGHVPVLARGEDAGGCG
ncbi:hypothetical protein [Streptomyces sp. MA5143a]|uniref:hypothetical protein n=1 Tax=Streptomyces sp. MA5143a TaxID=2083010 RepID=UPI0011B20E97|nr:hypothetical protein [Streptomyces sp. MA5143a]